MSKAEIVNEILKREKKRKLFQVIIGADFIIVTTLVCETRVVIYRKIISLAKPFLQQSKSVRNKIEQLAKLKEFNRQTFSQNCQIRFKNLAANKPANAARFLKCVWPFWDIVH